MRGEPERSAPARSDAETARSGRGRSGAAASVMGDGEEWTLEVDEADVEDAARRAVGRAKQRPRGSRGAKRSGSSSGGAASSGQASTRKDSKAASTEPADLLAAFTAAVGVQRGQRLAGRFEEATEAFADELFDEALGLLRVITYEAPEVAPGRELHGLTLYRLGRWKAAAKELEAYRDLTGVLDQMPVLADCYRAQGRWKAVERVWEELREARSLPSSVLSEGRIVAAGALADRGELRPAIELLANGWSWPKRPKEHHLRRGYALADLYERAGDLPRARQLFEAVAGVDGHRTDAQERLDSLH